MNHLALDGTTADGTSDSRGKTVGMAKASPGELASTGQTRLERKDMAAKLKSHGLLDMSEHPTVNTFLKSLKYLHKRDDLLFCIDSSRACSFLVRTWIADSL